MAIQKFAAICLTCLTVPAGFGAALTFSAGDLANNAATRTAWLDAIGIAAPAKLVNFESGFVDGQNIDSMPLAPGFLLDDTSVANVVRIECTPGGIGGSNPVGSCSTEHNEEQFLIFDFTGNPVDYVGFLHIDHTAVTNGGTIFFVGGGTQSFTLDETGGSPGNTEEFFGIFRNDMPAVTRLQIDVDGNGSWGVDNIEFGVAAVIPEPGTFALFGSGALFAAFLLRRKGTMNWPG
jgi:hypothetical protein